jgi:hypothetical protein
MNRNIFSNFSTYCGWCKLSLNTIDNTSFSCIHSYIYKNKILKDLNLRNGNARIQNIYICRPLERQELSHGVGKTSKFFEGKNIIFLRREWDIP